MAGVGSSEPLIETGRTELPKVAHLLPGSSPRTRQWRKPLSIEEIAQLAPTPEVRAREGRP